MVKESERYRRGAAPPSAVAAPRESPPPAVKIVLRLIPAVLFVYWVSLLFHRSTSPAILGRYSTALAIYICLVALGVVVALLGCRERVAGALWRIRYRMAGAVLLALVSFVTLEVATRAYMAFTQSPFYWLWGTRKANMMVKFNNDDRLTNQQNGYSKYPPNTFMRQGTYAHTLPTRINNLGFRGKDWSPEKAPGTFRIICLGASSTFGFGNRDDHTYPDYLERILNQEGNPGGRRFEVLNLGIPHMTSDKILALFEAEVIGYRPDVVTVYEGTNDTLHWEYRPGLQRSLKRINDDVKKYVLSWAILSTGLLPPRFISRQEIEVEGAARAATYARRMKAMHEKARANGIRLVLVTQQHTAFHALDRTQELRGLTYSEEVAQLRAEVERQGGTRRDIIYLLTHARIMDELRRLASREGIPLIDGIGALDQRRDLLHTWVHLYEEGNEMLARAMAPTLRTLAARSQSRAASTAHR